MPNRRLRHLQSVAVEVLIFLIENVRGELEDLH
jgi:hypothetical protein